MAYGHALVSSRLFVLFVILNHATDFFINSTSDVGAQTKTWHSFYLGQMVICGGYTTLPFCPFGSDIAIVSFRRRFFGRRLLYSSNGTSSFNPSTLQLILSGDIHPHPGPGSRKYQSIQFSRERKESESSMTINQYANQSNIKMAHLNIRSLKSREHFILLQHTIEEHKFDIFTLSETWLDSTVDSRVMQIPGFQFFRQDRGDHKSGGGLGIFIRDTFEVSCFEELSTVSNDNFQQLWIKVQVQKCKSLILCTVYRPPNTSMACIEALTCNFAELLHLGYDIIILGDLNCDLLNDTTPSRIISDFCDTLNLVQLVNEPTRITEFTQTLIDLVMTTNTNLIDSCSVLTSSISDHSLIEVVMKLRKPRIKPTYITTRSYSSYDKKSFLQDLEYAPWHMVNFFDNVDDQVGVFNSLFLEILNDHAPVKKIKIKSRPNPFVTREIKQLMKTRDHWRKKAIRTNDKLCWNGYRFFRQEVKKELRLAEKIYVREQILNNQGNTNAIWKVINRCMSRNNTAKALSNTEDRVAIANKFNRYFTPVGRLTALKANHLIQEQQLDVTEVVTQQEPTTSYDCSDCFNFKSVTEREVKSVIMGLSCNKAPGYDKILTLNTSKSNFVIFHPYQHKPDCTIQLEIYNNDLKESVPLEQKTFVKYLGILIDNNLSWKYHIDYISSKVSKGIGMIARLRHLVPFATLLNIYRSLIEPYISYGLIAWGQAANIHLNKILILQKRALRLMYFADSKAHSAPLFVHSRILPVTMLYYLLVSSMMHDINNHRVPSNISMLFTHSEQVHHHFTRFSAAGNLYVKTSRTNQLLFSFARIGVRVWNSIPMKLRIKNRTPFKRELKNRLLKLMEIEEMNVDLRCTEICKHLSAS